MKRWKYRWSDPDGRKGRWLNTAEGAVKSAVSSRFSRKGGGVKVTFCIVASLKLWTGMAAEGWSLEKCRKTK